MKQKFFIGLTIIVLSGCTSTNKFTRFVNERYPNQSQLSYEYKSDFLNVNTNDIAEQDSFCETERIKGIIVPAIFYWYWNNTVSCSVNPKFSACKMAYYLKTDAEAMGLKEKLNGSKINISIKTLPASFRYINKGHLIIALVAYTMIYKEGISPEQQNMIIEYEIIKNDSVIQKKTIEIFDKNEFIKQTHMSRKNLTWQYIDEYENNLKMLSKDAILKIANQL